MKLFAYLPYEAVTYVDSIDFLSAINISAYCLLMNCKSVGVLGEFEI